MKTQARMLRALKLCMESFNNPDDLTLRLRTIAEVSAAVVIAEQTSILDQPCECSQDAFDGEEPMCQPCQAQGALDAGIPRSVIEGKTKLNDHFSESYINFKCNRPDVVEE